MNQPEKPDWRNPMETMLKAIELWATVDEKKQLCLDEPLPIAGHSRVRVIVLFSPEAQVSEEEWLYAAARNPAFAFSKEPGEDIYSLTDGRPFHDQR
jgi:hypothetical protein